MLSREYKELIQRNIPSLVQTVDFTHSLLWDYLLQYNVISFEEKDEITSRGNTNYQQVREFLSYLLRGKGDRDFHGFCRALTQTNQAHVVNAYLTPAPGHHAVREPSPPRQVPHVHPASRPAPPAPRPAAEPGLGYYNDLPLNEPAPVHEEPERFVNGVQQSRQAFYERMKNRDDVYPMKKRLKGRALVINNYLCAGNERRGSDIDFNKVKTLLKNLNFSVLGYRDLLGSEIRAKLRGFAEEPANADTSSVFIVIMSHGERGSILGRDGEPVDINQIWDLFRPRNCPNLENKPKVFVLVACQGELMETVDEGNGGSVSVPGEQSLRPENGYPIQESSGGTQRDAHPPVQTPQYSDMFTAYSVMQGFQSLRDVYQGSWYVQEMDRVFRQQAGECTVQSMFDKISGRVSRRLSENGEMQQPETRSRLRKDLFIFPGCYDET